MRPVSAGTSNTSCTHSRTVSSTIGKVPYLAATASSCADRCRCCQSGNAAPAGARGSSSARAAHSRNRDANSAEPPSSAVISGSTLVRRRARRCRLGGGSSASGTRITIPSSVCSACTSMSRVALAQPGRDGQRPRGVHPRPVRAVQDQPPVAELVPEPLHHQRPVIGQVAGGLPLRRQVADQVRRGQLVEAAAAQPAPWPPARPAAPSSRQNAPSARPSSAGRPGRVAVPERQPARAARARARRAPGRR